MYSSILCIKWEEPWCMYYQVLRSVVQSGINWKVFEGRAYDQVA